MFQKTYIILLSTLFFSLPTFASFACFVEPTAAQPKNNYYLMSYHGPNSQEWHSYAQQNALQCSTKSKFELGLKAVNFSLQAGSVYAACTGVGAPAALWLQGGSLGVTLVEMVVGELDCEDTTTEEKVKAMAKEAICETMQNNGIECQPNSLK